MEFSVSLAVTIRPCRREDLPTLEWFGMFAHHRELIRTTFRKHLRGNALMLVAEANGVASGQVWIDLARGDGDSTGVIWAVRVFPALQNLGIGTRLMESAEQSLRERGFGRAELSVRRSNVAARRLYERLGYRIVRKASARAIRDRCDGMGRVNGLWVLRKTLVPDAETASKAKEQIPWPSPISASAGRLAMSATADSKPCDSPSGAPADSSGDKRSMRSA